jgi:hypothetical protein
MKNAYLAAQTGELKIKRQKMNGSMDLNQACTTKKS